MTLPDSVVVAGRRLTVRSRRHARARRVVMRLDAAAGEIRITTPAGVGPRRLSRFLRDHEGWIAARLAAAPAPALFEDGGAVPYRGRETRIAHAPSIGARVVWSDADGRLDVGGDAAHLARRLVDWLKADARRDLSQRARGYAADLDRRVARIRIGDPRSRWGSCSTTGALSFSWRLILAPDFVRDYVAAHEAAHLVEMNHSAAFWSTLRSVYPEIDAAQDWLKREGPNLRRYGAAAA